jgi:hypothetical protein
MGLAKVDVDGWLKRLRRLPKPLRLGVGIGLVIVGFLGFLPVLGFWMIPLGLVVLSVDSRRLRRWRRRLAVRCRRRRR